MAAGMKHDLKVEAIRSIISVLSTCPRSMHTCTKGEESRCSCYQKDVRIAEEILLKLHMIDTNEATAGERLIHSAKQAAQFASVATHGIKKGELNVIMAHNPSPRTEAQP